MRTFTVFAASYDALGAAEADFQAVHEFYMVAGLLDTYDAAVFVRPAAPGGRWPGEPARGPGQASDAGGRSRGAGQGAADPGQQGGSVKVPAEGGIVVGQQDPPRLAGFHGTPPDRPATNVKLLGDSDK